MTGHRYVAIVLLATAGALSPASTALSQTAKAPGLVQEGGVQDRAGARAALVQRGRARDQPIP